MRSGRVLALLTACGVALVALWPAGASLPAGGLGSWIRNDPQDILLVLASTAGWLIAAWIFVVTALAAISLSGAAGSALADRLIRLIAPVALRHMLEATLGVVLAVAPAGAAIAAPPAPGTVAQASTQASAHLAPLATVPPPIVAPPETALPDLDRPSSALPPAPARGSARGFTPTPAALGAGTPPVTPGASSAPVRHEGPTSTPRTAARPSRTSPAPGPTAIPSLIPTGLPSSSHRVTSGDTLWGLAAAQLPSAGPAEITRAWQQWYALNRAAIGPDPSLILPGEILTAPVVTR